VSTAVASWTFVIIYTVSMILWISLHKMGILHIDSQEFMKWNLWLSYFAGIQASIVLMASNRQANTDRKSHTKAWDLDKKTYKTVQDLCQRIQYLQDQLTILESSLDQVILEEGQEDVLY